MYEIVNAISYRAMGQTPVSAPTAAHKAPPAPPKIVYAPTRSFSQWVEDLPKDPALLIGFIVSLLSGVPQSFNGVCTSA